VVKSSIHIDATFYWWISPGHFEFAIATGPEKLRGAFGASATAQTQHVHTFGGLTSFGGVSPMASS